MRQVEGGGLRLTYKLEVRWSGLGTGSPEDGASRRCKNLGHWVKLANVLEDREDWQVRFCVEEGHGAWAQEPSGKRPLGVAKGVSRFQF